VAHLYLAPYVGAGKPLDPFRPRGSEQPGWAAIDLRPDGAIAAGRALVLVPVRDDTIGDYLGGSLDEVSTTVKSKIESKLGVTLKETTTRRMFAECLLVHGREDGTRWKPLRVQRDGKYRVWLGGKTPLWEANTLAGGSSIADTFNRADSDLDGSTSSDAQFIWSEVLGTGFTVASNQCSSTSNSGELEARAQFDLATDDHYAQVALVSLDTSANAQGGPVCRFAAAASTYYFHRAVIVASSSLNDHRLSKSIAGSITDLATDATDVVNGEVLKVQADADQISAYRNGTLLIGPVTDTSIAGNLRCGLWALTSGAVTAIFDSFEAGDLAAAGLSIPVAMAQYRQRWN